jgi:hypothetical protein
LGYEAEHELVQGRPGLHIHTFGPRGDLVDEEGFFRDAYALTPGEWVLIRPDGYVGAIVASAELQALEGYLQRVGVAMEHPAPV